MSETKADVTLTEGWQDLTTLVSGTASVGVRLQCVRGVAAVIHGGGAPSGDRSGDILRTLDSVEANAAAIWVKSVSGGARISVTLT